MSKKPATYEELLVEKQKLEVLFQAQKTLVQFELDDLKKEFNPAINTLEFLKSLAVRNHDNPILQTGANLLIDWISDKTHSSKAGFFRTAVVPFILKNYASNIIATYADDLIGEIISLFDTEEAADNNESENENTTDA
jgi:hypothetical protein